jgi:hypothetical protein
MSSFQVTRVSMLFLFPLALMLAQPAIAQDDQAKGEDELQRTADASLTLSQTGYGNSWVGDEAGSLTWTFNGNLLWTSVLSARLRWRHDVNIVYGQTLVQQEDAQGERHWSKPDKSSDRIFYESLLKAEVGSWVEPYTAVTVETQFYDAGDHALSPAVIAEAVGGGGTLVDNDRTNLFTRLGLGVRQRLQYGNTTITDGGLEWVTDLTQVFSEKKVTLTSKLRVFQAFINNRDEELEASGFGNDWQSPDMIWDSTLTATVTSHIQTTLFVEVLYDKEISKQGRWRDVLGLALSYKLF